MSHWRKHILKDGETPVDPEAVHHIKYPAHTNPTWAAVDYQYERRGQPNYREDEQGNRYRKRRGKWVLIPAKWVGQVTNKQTIRKRASKKGRGASYRRF